MKSKQCKFCNQREDGGVDLLATKVDIGELGELEAGVTFFDYKKNQIPSSLHIWVWRKFGNSGGEQLGEEISLPINYCPMCGRKLTKSKPESEKPERDDDISFADTDIILKECPKMTTLTASIL